MWFKNILFQKLLKNWYLLKNKQLKVYNYTLLYNCIGIIQLFWVTHHNKPFIFIYGPPTLRVFPRQWNVHEGTYQFRNFSPVTINLVDRVGRLGKVCLIYVFIWCPVCAPNAKPPSLPPSRYRRISISCEAVCFIRNYLMSHSYNWGIFFRNLLTMGPSSQRD